MTQELLPCPFCGGEAVLRIGLAHFDDAQIDCQLCEASGPNFNESPFQGIGAQNFNTAEAVSAWNRRASFAGIENPAAFVEAARGMADKADDALKALVGVDRLLHQYGLMQGEDCPAIDPLRTALTAFRATLGEDAA